MDNTGDHHHRIGQALSSIEQKALEIRCSLDELLSLLNMDDKVPWPEMLDKLATLAHSYSQLQTAMHRKSSTLSAGSEDLGSLLRSHVILPQQLSIDIDSVLEQVTEGRVNTWNHDVLPEYLRTKLTQDVDNEELALENEKNTKGGADMTNKQIAALNRHVELLTASLPDARIGLTDAQSNAPNFAQGDTQRLVRAVILGEQLNPNLRRPESTGSVPGPGQSVGVSPAKTTTPATLQQTIRR